MNIYDIAKEAGVSIATVSRVLNNKGTVTPATRAKVEAVLEKNNYTPSAIARGMMSKSLRTVAILTVDIRVPHYARTAYTIEREFSRRGYEVILCNTGGDRETTLKYLRAVIEKQVDGIVLVGSVFNIIGKDPEIEALLRVTPVVLANGKLDLPNAYSVLVDDSYGVQMAAKYLVSIGKKNLLYIKDMDTDSARKKAEGFASAMEHYSMDATGRIVSTNDSLQGGINAVSDILRSKIPFDSIICGEDLTAVGIVKGLKQAGLRVPEDIAVTGFNNSMYAKLCDPELTSIDNKPEQVALFCVQLLEGLLNGGEGCASVTIQPEIVIGSST